MLSRTQAQPSQTGNSTVRDKMNDIDNAVADVLVNAYDCLSRNEAEQTAYDFHIRSLMVAPSRKAGYGLLTKFNAFCDKHEIEYFAFATTLIGAVTYQDFFPGEMDVNIGMTREEYLKLEKAFERDDPEDLVLNAFFDFEKTSRTPSPTVSLKFPDFIKEDGHYVFGDDNLPLQANPLIVIGIFDVVPKDYDVSRAFYFQMKLINEQFEKAATPKRQQKLSRLMWKTAGAYNNSGHNVVSRLFPARSKTIKLSDLRPTRKLPFGPTEIKCPRVTTTWVVENNDSELEQVKYLQKDALKIAKEIDRICRANGIGYFVCGGTMLGHVRHDGFIPWDDDVDVGMLRDDYMKFLEVAPSQLGEEFFLQSRESDPNAPYLFSKVRLRDTEYITAYNEFRDFNKGICVDIFPFDRAPIGDYRMIEFKKKVDSLIRAHNSTANRQVPKEGLAKKKASNPVEALEQTVMKLRHARNWNKSLADTQKAYDETVTSFNDDESLKFVASYVATFTCVHLDDLLPLRDVEFEGTTLKVPNHPEVFMQMQYGDYMIMPLLHQQRGHGLLRWKGTEKSSEDFK